MRVKIGRADRVRSNVAREIARNVLLPEVRSGVNPSAIELSDADDAQTLAAQALRTKLLSIPRPR